MPDSPSDTRERLRALVRTELQDQATVQGFDIARDEFKGVLVTVRDTSGTHLYHVTLDRFPDGVEDTHWEYMGEVDDQTTC